jgi:hypothetical protein
LTNVKFLHQQLEVKPPVIDTLTAPILKAPSNANANQAISATAKDVASTMSAKPESTIVTKTLFVPLQKLVNTSVLVLEDFLEMA